MITLVINSNNHLDFYFLDVFSAGIHIPSSLAMSSIYASLRMKHDVLILTRTDITEVDFSKRFSYGDHFIHLSPRFLSFLIDNYSRQTLDLQEFKAFLVSSK